MTLWLRRLFVMFSLVASCGAQAWYEVYVSPISLGWCPQGYLWRPEEITCYDNYCEQIMATRCNYSSDVDAAKVGLIGWTVNCDGNGHCNAHGGEFTYIFQVQQFGLCPSGYVFATSRQGHANICLKDFWNSFTITLSGSSNQVEPSNSSTIITLPFIVTVKDQTTGQPPTIPVTVKISLKVDDPTSGGHDHGDSMRPRGGVGNVGTCPSDDTCWSFESPANNGVVVFNFNPTKTSGKYIISATCDKCNNTETKPVDVKVSGLITIPASPLYALSDSKGVIGAIPGKHTDNHYLTSTAITKLVDLAGIYTALNPGAILYLNDASLVWGGLYDVGTTPWVSPHSLHDKGRSLDIRAANSGPNNEGSVPATLFGSFLDKSRRQGFKIGLHCKNSTDTNYCLGQPNNRHFHVDF